MCTNFCQAYTKNEKTNEMEENGRNVEKKSKCKKNKKGKTANPQKWKIVVGFNKYEGKTVAAIDKFPDIIGFLMCPPLPLQHAGLNGCLNSTQFMLAFMLRGAFVRKPYWSTTWDDDGSHLQAPPSSEYLQSPWEPRQHITVKCLWDSG